MEAESSSDPFRRAKLPSSSFESFGSFGSLMPEGERIALEGLCNLMRSIAPELLSEVPSVDEVIRSSAVVIFLIFALAAILAAYDLFWWFVLRAIQGPR
jgi:hypothetical protein